MLPSWITERRSNSFVKVVLPAPGVATARKSSGRSARYFFSAASCQARSGREVPQAARCGYAGERLSAAKMEG